MCGSFVISSLNVNAVPLLFTVGSLRAITADWCILFEYDGGKRSCYQGNNYRINVSQTSESSCRCSLITTYSHVQLSTPKFNWWKLKQNDSDLGKTNKHFCSASQGFYLNNVVSIHLPSLISADHTELRPTAAVFVPQLFACPPEHFCSHRRPSWGGWSFIIFRFTGHKELKGWGQIWQTLGFMACSGGTLSF